MTSAPATATADKPAEANGIGIGNEQLATNLPVAPRQPKAPLNTGGRVQALVPGSMEEAYRLARAIAESGAAPKAYLNDPKKWDSGFNENKILAGILHGLEVGLTPFAALQSIAVVNGMPSLWGDGMLGIVRSSGLLVDIQEFIEGDANNPVAVCRCLRAGQATPIIRTFGKADAAKAGLLSKEGPWKLYPQRMMQMRARSWALRDGFADVLRGLHSAEEAIDMGELQQQSDGSFSAAQTLPPPPAPTRAAIAATVDAEKVIEQDLGRGSDRMPDTDEERGDEPEEGDDGSTSSDQAAPEPVQIPVPTGADNKPDWSAWADTVKGTVAQAPDADWLRAWNVMHSSALNNLKKAAAALHADVIAAIENRRKELAGG